MKLPFEYMNQNNVASSACMWFLCGQDEKARIYRDVYFSSKELTTELLEEHINYLSLVIEAFCTREEKRKNMK